MSNCNLPRTREASTKNGLSGQYSKAWHGLQAKAGNPIRELSLKTLLEDLQYFCGGEFLISAFQKKC